MIDLDDWKPRLAPGAEPTIAPAPIERTEKVRIVVSPETLAILEHIAAASKTTAPAVAGRIVEELRREGQLRQVYKAACNRLRRKRYRERYGSRG